jgi:hypothetical protein
LSVLVLANAMPSGIALRVRRVIIALTSVLVRVWVEILRAKSTSGHGENEHH